jgi:uncharacterized protein
MNLPISFSSTGPEDWMTRPDVPLEYAKLIEGKPMGLDHAYFTRPNPKIRAGIWRSSAYTEWYDSYPCDEFMYVLEGHVIMECEGYSKKFGKGDAFFVPKGFKGYWKQPVAMLKYYVIIE